MPLLPNSLVTNWEQVVYIGTQKERERRDHDGIMCTCVRPSVHKVVDTTSLLDIWFQRSIFGECAGVLILSRRLYKIYLHFVSGKTSATAIIDNSSESVMFTLWRLQSILLAGTIMYSNHYSICTTMREEKVELDCSSIYFTEVLYSIMMERKKA